MREVRQPRRHPRLFAAVLVPLLACAACANGHGPALSIDLDARGPDSAPFAIRKQALYSISYRCAIRDAAARREAWLSLEATTSSKDAWTPRLSVIPEGTDEARLIRRVGFPRLSSWNGQNLYIELARVELGPGRYTLRHSVPPPVANPPCRNSLIVVPAYIGK